MSYIEQVARDTLQAAHGDLAKARGTLLLVAGVLALIHLLTVYPYLEASREIAGIEASIAANATLLARIEPETVRLRQAGEGADAQLTGMLDGVTEQMVGSFAELRTLVERALSGELPDAAQPSELTTSLQMQQMPMQMQMPQGNMPLSPMQAPSSNLPIQQMAPDLPLPGEAYPPSGYPSYVAPELAPVLAALAAGEPDAYDRLIAYARRDIVADAYARAQEEWSGRIRPAFLGALAATEEGARRAADSAPASAAQTAAALRTAADDMARQRSIVEAIEIRHDTTVDEALGTDWWRTVPGKGAYADAVAQSVAEQMHDIVATAVAPSVAIRETLDLQEQLRAQVQRRQQELEQQFAEQRKQLATLSGASGVVPVDLASFIGLFPLVLGLVLGFMLLRAGQARRQAALAAGDLARAAPEDRDTRIWLVRRMLGGGEGLAPLLATIALAFGALLWIALAAFQVAGSPSDPPLAPWISATLAALAVLVAAAWDVAAIKRLTGTS
jgi:hypothetical protein